MTGVTEYQFGSRQEVARLKILATWDPLFSATDPHMADILRLLICPYYVMHGDQIIGKKQCRDSLLTRKPQGEEKRRAEKD